MRGVSRLRAVLDRVDLESGGVCGAVCDAAFSLALGARYLGFHETPLHVAAHAGALVVVRLLVASGVQIEAQNRAAETAMRVAGQQGHQDVLLFLTKARRAALAPSNFKMRY